MKYLSSAGLTKLATLTNERFATKEELAANNKNTSRTVEFIKTTNTAADAALTGVTEDTALYDGKTIFLYLTYAAGNNATLNLTLADGTTTGAKNVYLTGATRLGTHYAAGSVIALTYVLSDNGWRRADYDSNSNNYDRRLHNNNIKAAAAITAGTVIVGTSAGYKVAASGVTFDLAYPILYASAAIAANAAAANTYEAMPGINLATTKTSWTGTQYAIAWLVGTISGNTVTIDSSVFTTTVPTATDNKVYIPLGLMASTNQIFFAPTGDVYQYINNAFRKITPGLASGAYAAAYSHPSAGANTGSFGPSANATPAFGGTFNVPYVTVNSAGHTTAASTKTVTIPNTAATQSAAGLMSAADKTKLDGIATGAQVNTVTGIKGNSESSYRTGNVNLTAANIGAAAASHGNHVPATQTANNAVFLRNDNTWQTVTPTNIGAAAANHTHTTIVTTGDHRNDATTPASYSNNLIFQGLKTNSKIGSPSSDTYSYLVGLKGWIDSSGGLGHELAFNNSGIMHRIGTSDSAWGAWESLLTSNSTLNATKLSGTIPASCYTDTKYTHPSAGANTGSFGPSANASPAHGGTFSVPYLTVNSDGHVTAASTKTITLPAAPTSVTSATKLATARAIDGVNFDGSAAITHYGTCSTAAATAAKTVACTSYTLVTGSRIIVKFTVTNTAASPTLNVNSTGAKAIQYRGAAITAGYLAANRTYEFVYDGTNYQLVGDIDTNTTYSGITDSEISTAWGSSDPLNNYIENSVYSMTAAEIAAAWNDVQPISGTSDASVTGDLYVDGDIFANHVYNAVYNDYAEFFPRGEATEPGDVIVLDIDQAMGERYIKSRADNKIVVGVHSDEYAFLIGGNDVSKEENMEDFIPVSLAGRVKVKFIGPAKKGNYVVASETSGVARAYKKGEDNPEDIFGILVEQDYKDNEIRRLRIKLK